MVVNGEPFWNFHFEYDFDGSTYAFCVPARSEVEAHARMKKIALSRYKGQGDGAPTPLRAGGFFVPLIVWFRNWRQSL